MLCSDMLLGVADVSVGRPHNNAIAHIIELGWTYRIWLDLQELGWTGPSHAPTAYGSPHMNQLGGGPVARKSLPQRPNAQLALLRWGNSTYVRYAPIARATRARTPVL